MKKANLQRIIRLEDGSNQITINYKLTVIALNNLFESRKTGGFFSFGEPEENIK